MKKNVFKKIIMLLCLVTTACNGKAHTKIDPIDDNFRVFYQIFVGSFSDSNGDGIGDLRGIINRMDYLNDGDINSNKSLGVQGLWLSPIFESPTYHKYDVKDYYEIDKSFGTFDDLKELIDICHKRNVSIIIDLPINHTSNQHSWFLNFKSAHVLNNSNDKYYDYYTHVTADEKLANHKYYSISGLPTSYEANFSSDMPELNFDNEEVFEECVNIAKYYLDLGIDGFRFDAAKYIYYNNDSKSIDFWKKYVSRLKEINKDVYTVGEVWSSESETIPYFEALNCFNFQSSGAEGTISSTIKNSNSAFFANYISNYQQKILKVNEFSMMAPFISNHDMDRSAGYLLHSYKRTYMAANLLLLCYGSPFIYYGEEIAMKGSRGAANTDANRRLAMLWGDDDTIKDPTGSTFDKSSQKNGTVAQQLKDSESLLNHYRKVISIRNKYKEIARGSYDPIIYSNEAFAGWKITYQNSTIGLFHNTSFEELTINLSENDKYCFNKILDYVGCGHAELSGNTLVIGPYTSVILK